MSDTTLAADASGPGGAATPDAPVAALPPARRRRGLWRRSAAGAALVGWAGGVVLAILGGVFDGDGAARLAMPAAVVAPVATLAILYRRSRRFRTYLLGLNLRLVVAAQLWRVVGVAFLVTLAFERLPAGFAVPAGVGDIATGVAALGVVAALDAGALTRGRLYAFTALGLADFLVAFVTGLWLAPQELTVWPLVVFPTVLVPFFVMLHLVAVIQLSRVERSGRVPASRTSPSNH